MSRTLVLNKYRCEHVEPFRLGREHVQLFKDYLHTQEGSSGKTYFIANSIECRECLTLASAVKKERSSRQLHEFSSQSVLPSHPPDLHGWYLDLLHECREMPLHEGLRLLQLWTRDVVYLFPPPEIEAFYRRACGAPHDMAVKAELSAAMTGALTTKTVEQRAVFWDELNRAFEVPNLITSGRRADPKQQQAASMAAGDESKCSKIIYGLVAQLEEDTKLLRLITCGCPGSPALQPEPRLKLARKRMQLHEAVVASTVAALKSVLDSLQTLSLDNDDPSQHGEVANAVAAGRFLTVALYQLHAQQKSIMWQLAMNAKIR
ncbi:hypothetical protein SLS62_008979 [Diatrype stigma]|uniref:Uncharacterized protein n=1 Tax=Diatrype stigma TaxID=117547 RepID=A0AAN9US06_9PEZI